MKIPERGDIIVFDFSPTSGHEQSGIRPAIVLTNIDFNRGGLVFVCPITSTERGHFFEVKVEAKETRGVILVHQLRSIDYVSRNVKIVDRANTSTTKEVIDKVKIILS